jgi:TetR/AcrR family transcriptional repressor of nem operon
MTKAERTKKFIIEKSAPIINKKGMAGTSLQDIMEATKLAKGGIYGNFESKDEIYLESFNYLAGLLATELDDAAQQGKSAKSKFFNLLDAYKGEKTFQGGCPILNFGVESDDTHPEMKMKVKKAIRRSQERIFNIVFEGLESGELLHTISPERFSIKVFAMIEGAYLCGKVLGTGEQMRIIIEEIKNEFIIYLA